MAQTYAQQTPSATQNQNASNESAESHRGRVAALVLGCIGVVYGDIGTSPLYALKQAATAVQADGRSGVDGIIGMVSMIFWCLTLIVTIKYVLILLRADNKGEGGTFALMSLAQQVLPASTRWFLALGVAGAAFFYGDAVITPAVSVLSALEGLEIVAPTSKPYVLPAAVVILALLFWAQSRGTDRISKYFGPVMLIWFAVLFVGGLFHIHDDIRVLQAINPMYGVRYVAAHGLDGLEVMGLVFLAVTGAEALYADLGHFGRRPIQIAWLGLVFPALVINYFGQAAMLMADPSTLDNPFYKLYPVWALWPMLILATAATVIASQAVITGAYSVTRQAVQLGLLPRLQIRHTSASVAGQIYMPRVNTLLLIGVLFVTLTFKNADSLGAAYGVSVTGTMVISTILAFFVIWRVWRWPLWRVAVVMVPLLLLEQSFLVANMLKVLEGGWLPLLLAVVMCSVMLTWQRGSRALAKITRSNEAELDWLIRKLQQKAPHTVPGTAVFLTSDPTHAPTSLMHNLKHNKVLHERNIILSIRTVDTPRVQRHERVTVEKIANGFVRVIARYGFMETPSVPKIFEHCRRKDLNVDLSQTSFFLSRRSLKPSDKSDLHPLEERLFIALAGAAADATEYFRIPTDRVVEVGTQVLV
jgi:KUP system potassium uptake protein